MLDLENRLFVFHDDNSVFTDHSNSAQDYARDEFAIELDKDNDYLYIGYRKAINTIFVEMNTVNSIANSFTLERFNDDTSAFVEIDTFSDDTKGLTRSGFIVWERNLEDEGKTEINGQEAFWYRLRPSATHSAGTKIQGLNNVFSDDQDLREQVSSILSTSFLAGADSHILSHVAARKQIIQDLRNSGKLKVDTTTGRFKNLNLFDILDVGQIRDASKWKTLNIIFDDLSDRTDDKWEQKARKYNSRYKTTFGQLQFLAIDVDDDGRTDINEEQASATTLVLRR